MRPQCSDECFKETQITCIEFGENTTAHGVPRATKARTIRGRLFWCTIVLVCLVVFLVQAIMLIVRFSSFDTTTQIELTSYDRASSMAAPSSSSSANRRKREHYPYLYQLTYAGCRCDENQHECAAIDGPPTKNGTETCICLYETSRKEAQPCYRANAWSFDTWCKNCSLSGRCTQIQLPKIPTPANDELYADVEPCACEALTKRCYVTLDRKLPNLWSLPILTTTAAPTTTELPMTADDISYRKHGNNTAAIQIQASQNVMFAVNNMPLENRTALSHQLTDFIQTCVFNGTGCEIQKDFRLHVDPIYGNCYVFNFDGRLVNTSRAGPVFGLRMTVNLDVDEYMPMTQELGARIAIHENDSYPFPDVFGYNAPAGFTSSFGIRLKRVKRMQAPYGQCSENAKTEDYIYKEYNYSTEGCYRTCRQKEFIKKCECGDPRFPVPPGAHHCSSDDAAARDCLERAVVELGVTNSTGTDCTCPQPCEQSVYEPSFSAAKWPVGRFSMSAALCDGSLKECTERLRENNAVVEVFFEQLNCEYLKESPAYPLVNLLADLGGQLGLWLGFSVITLVEIGVLIWDLLQIYCYRRKPPVEYKSYNGDLYGTQSVECTLQLRAHSVY